MGINVDFFFLSKHKSDQFKTRSDQGTKIDPDNLPFSGCANLFTDRKSEEAVLWPLLDNRIFVVDVKGFQEKKAV